MKSLFALLFALALLFASSCVFAQESDDVVVENDEGNVPPVATSLTSVEDEEEEEEEKPSMPPPSPDAEVFHVFPDFLNKRFMSGDIVKLAFNFRNTGSKLFNVTHVQGYLASPFDTSFHIQNFTRRDYEVSVNPNEEATLMYPFRPDPNLEPIEFMFVAHVFYHTASGEGEEISITEYSTVVYNATVELLEAPSDANARQFFTYFAMLAITGLTAVFGYRFIQKKASKSKRTEYGTSRQRSMDDSDWLAGIVDVKKKKKPTPSKKQ